MLFLAWIAVGGGSGWVPSYADATAAWEVDHRHAPGLFTYGMGGGAALFDMDGDGDDDLICTSGNGQHRLYRNDGARMTDVTSGANVAQHFGCENLGVAAGDFDQDGLPDLFLTNSGPNTLLRNLGHGRFEDVTDRYGIAGDSATTAAAWADFDRDGDLDLYVGNYIATVNYPYHVPARNGLWINVGTATEPHFRHAAAPGAEGCTLSVSTWDYDDDGDTDLLVGNDFGAFVTSNQLLRNVIAPHGGRAFVDVSETTGFGSFPQYNMGIGASDYDRDGDWDYYLSNLGDNALLRNDGGTFVDVAPGAGPVEGTNEQGTLLLSSWGTAWLDADNDGWEDLFVGNGYIPSDPSIANDPRSPNSLWMNARDGTFQEVASPALADEGAARAALAADLDGDGAVEIVVVNNGHANVAWPEDATRVFAAAPHPEHHWIEVRLQGVESNTEALGARVDARVGGEWQRRQVSDTSMYLSSPSRVVRFGLGESPAVDVLRIRWPSGREQVLRDLPGDRRHTIREPARAAR